MELKLLTWNLERGFKENPETGDFWPGDQRKRNVLADQVVDRIVEENADLMFFQEMPCEVRARLNTRLNCLDEIVYQNGWLGIYANKSRESCFNFEERISHCEDHNRFLAVKVSCGNNTLDLVCVHLGLFNKSGPIKGGTTTEEKSQTMHGILDHQQFHGKIQVFAGDFNSKLLRRNSSGSSPHPSHEFQGPFKSCFIDFASDPKEDVDFFLIKNVVSSKIRETPYFYKKGDIHEADACTTHPLKHHGKPIHPIVTCTITIP